MRKIKILGIAPYNNLALLMSQAAKERDDMEMSISVGDLDEGAQIAAQYTGKDFDFILSRGGTAQRIRQTVSIPVMEIEVSTADLLRCMQIAQSATHKYALIAFPNITKNSAFLKSLFHYHMDIFTIHNPDEAEILLKNFSPNQYDIILGDSVVTSVAKSHHFRTILITSGLEAVEGALNNIAFFWSLYHKTFLENSLYRSLLNTHPFDIYVFSQEAELIFHSREDVYSTELVNLMTSLVPSVMQEGKRKVYRKYSGLLASISGSQKSIGSQNIIQFYVNFRKLPLSLFKKGLHYKNKEDILKNSDNLYLNYTSPDYLDKLLQPLLSTAAPVFILSERGMARDDFAEAFYLQSEEHCNPLTRIDCARLANDKNWDYLMQDMNSPLSDTETTIYIKNIDILPEGKFRELLSSIHDTQLHLRNRILFEMAYEPGKSYPERCISIRNRFNCSVIILPPLRLSKDQIPCMANLLINAFNEQFGREVVGFQPEALTLLSEYDWPYNYTQLRHIITKLGNMTGNSLIEADAVRNVLRLESPGSCRAASSGKIPESKYLYLSLDKTLESMTRDIIEAVLHEEGNNQSAAAKRLGISRTTLWRILR